MLPVKRLNLAPQHRHQRERSPPPACHPFSSSTPCLAPVTFFSTVPISTLHRVKQRGEVCPVHRGRHRAQPRAVWLIGGAGRGHRTGLPPFASVEFQFDLLSDGPLRRLDSDRLPSHQGVSASSGGSPRPIRTSTSLKLRPATVEAHLNSAHVLLGSRELPQRPHEPRSPSSVSNQSCRSHRVHRSSGRGVFRQPRPPGRSRHPWRRTSPRTWQPGLGARRAGSAPNPPRLSPFVHHREPPHAADPRHQDMKMPTLPGTLEFESRAQRTPLPPLPPSSAERASLTFEIHAGRHLSGPSGWTRGRSNVSVRTTPTPNAPRSSTQPSFSSRREIATGDR